jgi:hypothetical protein
MKRFTILFSALLYVGVSLHTSANANEYPDLNMQEPFIQTRVM